MLADLRARSPSERCQRRAAQTAKDLGMAPLALASAGTKLSSHEPSVALERGQRG